MFSQGGGAVDTFKTGAEVVPRMFKPVSPGRRAALAATALSAVALLGGWTVDGHAVAGLGLLLFGTSGDRSLRGLVVAIAVGAVVVGAIAWLASGILGGPLSTGVAAGLGIAVGGGLGSVIWLLAVGEEEPERPEEVTVDMGEDEDLPEPEPADLFEASPDPILYYGGPEPQVRAVNPAFVETFDVEATAVEGVPLADALQVGSGSAALVDAATAGRAADETLPCETGDGTVELRVRVIPVGSGDRPAGYVVYGPLEPAA